MTAERSEATTERPDWRRWLPQDTTDWLLIAIMMISTAVLLLA
jgi:hypothetical protein